TFIVDRSAEVQFIDDPGTLASVASSPYLTVKRLQVPGSQWFSVVGVQPTAGFPRCSLSAAVPVPGSSDMMNSVDEVFFVINPRNPEGNFPSDIVHYAVAAKAKWKVPASISLGQWALESDWGNAMPDGSNNPFGVKATPGGPSAKATTIE